MDELSARIVNRLQRGIPAVARPFEALARELGTDEAALLARLEALLADGTLTRFGPLFNADRLGGAFTLCAMSVPEAEFDRVAAAVNALPEVAHNYARDHRLNMWFVLATEDPARIARALERVERETGYAVLDFPKLDEYFVRLELAA